MRHRPTRYRVLWTIAVVSALVLSAGPSQAENEDDYPGLPDPVGVSPSWANSAQNSMAYAGKTKQYVRVPDALVTSVQSVKASIPSPGLQVGQASARAYFVSPADAPEDYGYLAPMTIRTVGFGLMPVEATVQVSQRRENGLPVPIDVVLDYETYRNGDTGVVREWVAKPAIVQDRFNVQILDVKVDGNDLGLTGDCRTVEPALMRMVGPGYTKPPGISDEEFYSNADPTTYFHPLFGGQLRGTLTMPPLTGCTTAAGDDLSVMMTRSVAGSDNHVVAQVLSPCGYVRPGKFGSAPLPKGMNTPVASGCPARKLLPYPARPAD